MTDSSEHVACVGGILHAPDGRLLLVRRANAPGRGLWSIPGGRVEAGEDDHTAVVREMFEETGLHVVPGRVAGRVVVGPYRIVDYVCTLAGPAPTATPLPVAGDDAADARFVDLAAFRDLPRTEGLEEALTAWGCLPRH
ncbi:NUDIX hydrolase [Pseudonocardia phyllosphaerae]|uniref:NUDIX hydrolase n=1 Tax=Pseudonocardia phyllosphaerae TaxID=3390502 RepID=UPI0039797AD9